MKKLISLILVLALSLAPLALAEELNTPNSVKVEGNNTVENAEAVSQALEESKLLLNLKKQLAQAKYRYFVLQNNVEVAKEELILIQETSDRLKAEVEALDEVVSSTKGKIRNVKTQTERQKMDIEDIEEETQVLELLYEDQKKLVGELMRILYLKRGVYYDENGVNPIKVLASPDSISETFQKITYFDLVEAESRAQMDELERINEELKTKWNELRVKRGELDALNGKLKAELRDQTIEKNTKVNMLREIEEKQSVYEAMLLTTDDKAEDVLREIEIYQSNVDHYTAKLNGTRILLSDEQQELIDQIEAESDQSFDLNEASGAIDMDWPVSPKGGITATFKDSGYVEVFGVPHRAIDVRAKKGTPILAPADGVVSKVVFKEGSTRYAYVMLALGKGIVVSFGHVNQVLVQPGDYVKRGQPVALSGGAPGDVGSGEMTTGPHLHMEVWQNGVLVDPLLFLPLNELPPQYIPENYLKQVQTELEDQIVEFQEALLD